MGSEPYLDFLGIGGSSPIVYAPGEKPNPKNPGGVSDNKLAYDKRMAATAQAKARLAAALAADAKKRAAEFEKKQKATPFLKGLGADLKVLAPAVLGAVGTAAAVVATGGAAAGALGLGAGLASVAAGAGAVAKGVSSLQTGVKVATAVSKGDVKALASLATQQLPPELQAQVKTGLQVATAASKGDVKALATLATQQLPPAVQSTLALPGLAKGAADKVASVKAAAEVLVAGAEAGLGKATEVYHATRELALGGHPDAVAAVAILAQVVKERAASSVPIGEPRPLNAKGEAALTAFAAGIQSAPVYQLTPALAQVGPPALAPVPPSSAPSSAVAGQLINVDTGRLNFASFSWRPVTATTKGALRGLVVTNAGRIAFDEWWVGA